MRVCPGGLDEPTFCSTGSSGWRWTMRYGCRRFTLGADKGYDAAEFVEALQALKVIPHIAQNTSNRRSAVSDEVAASAGHAISQQKRKLIEPGFGRAKLIGPIRQVMVRGMAKVDQVFVPAMTGYNLVRMRTPGQLRLQSGATA